MVKSFALLLTILSPFILFGQGDSLISIRGSIKDSSGINVPNAVIKFKPDTSFIRITAFGFSDRDGNYLIQVPKIDSGFVEISCIGYATLIEKIIFKQNREEKRDFVLSLSEAFLSAVSVTALPKIIQKKDTILFNAERYRKDNQQNIEDLLKSMPGFQISDNGVSMAGRLTRFYWRMTICLAAIMYLLLKT